MGSKTFSYSLKNQDFWSINGQIWPKKCFFLLNIGIFGPFDPIADQKSMRTRCLGSFSITRGPKLLLPPVRIKIFGPKGKIWSKICICGHVPNIGKTLCFSTISLRIANISRQSVANKQEKEVIFMAHYILGNEK